MNSLGAICRSCLAENVALVDLFSNYDFPAPTDDSNGGVTPSASTTTATVSVQLATIYSQLTQLPVLLFPAAENEVPSRICFDCMERLKEFHLFRQRAAKAYEELHTKASIARIISQLDQSSSVGSVRNDRLEEDFAEDLIAGDEDLDKSRFKKPLAAGEQRCDVCQKVFKNRKMLARHQEIHSSENKYKCRYCGRWFRARSSWYNHELKHRNALGREEKLEQEFLCEVCAKGFKTNKQLKDHLEIVHQGIKRFRCDICSKSFTRNGSLAEHKLIQHAEIKQFSCSICARTFGKEDSLKTHLSTHLGRRFRCELCSKTFLKRAFLTAHVAKAHPTDDGPKPNACTICGKNFSSSSHLKDHSLIHTNAKPEVCKVCGASFRQKQQLKVHMYQHSGKPFKCQFCSAAFGIKVRLLSHLQKNHPNELQNMSTQQQQQSLPVAPEIINEPDFGDGAVNEEILNEICYQINEHIVFFDDANNLLPDELYDFTKQGYGLPEQRDDLNEGGNKNN